VFWRTTGQIVGHVGAEGAFRSFLYQAGAFTPFNYPDFEQSAAIGINNTGQIVGYFFDNAGKRHGYVATNE
jgi:probable HAF family extracellular repeat protein